MLVLFVLGAAPAWAQANFTTNFVTITGTNQAGGVNNKYYTGSPTNAAGSPKFDGASLGTFNRTTANENSLFINAEANTSATNNYVVQSAQLQYRVYRVDDAGQQGSPIPLDLPYASGVPSEKAVWQNVNPNGLDLLSLVVTRTPGTYYLEVSFSGQATDPNSTVPASFLDENGGNLYKATFNVLVNGNQFITSTWNSTASQDWFNVGNWTDGVPTSNTDVVIEYYPGIRTPQINKFESGEARTARVRNLTIIGDGSLPTVRGVLTQNENTTLLVSGNFQDGDDGFAQNGGVLELNGQNQTLDVSGTILNLAISNSSGSGGSVKTLSRGLTIGKSLVFRGVNSGTLATGNRSNQAITLEQGVTLQEYEGAYISGLVIATQDAVVQGQKATFGNIGLDITPNSASAGKVTVTRTSSNFYRGIGTSVSIRRGFSITAENNSLTSFDLTFHYLNDNLNGIAPANLRMFRSVNGRVPFEGLALTSTGNKTLTRTGISGLLAAVFTLGDVNNPLPVELVSFTATGTAQGASLKWLTASEVNSKGFAVERQVAGATTWQQVGYVDATNKANGSSYSFLDKNIPASATQVYYRLRQEDFDGTLSYSPVATISRAAQGADLTLSPVPLQSGPLAVSFAEAGQAGTEILVLNMQGQRVARYTTTASADEAVHLSLDQLAAGVYQVSVQVPGQATRHARFVKQ
jgi:hypothetical protein